MPIEKSMQVLGSRVDILAGATGHLAFGAVVQTCTPGDGPPPHIHTQEDEFFYPVEGDFEIFDGERWTPLLATGFSGPRQGTHTFRNCGATTGKILVIVSPFHNLHAYFERLKPHSIPADLDKIIAISAEHGIRFILPEFSETELRVERESSLP